MRTIQVNADRDTITYDGEILEVFFLDGSKRFRAARLRYDVGDTDRTGAVLLQLWATPAQMVGMVRIEADHVSDVESLVAEIEGSAPRTS